MKGPSVNAIEAAMVAYDKYFRWATGNKRAEACNPYAMAKAIEAAYSEDCVTPAPPTSSTPQQQSPEPPAPPSASGPSDQAKPP